MTNYFVSKNGFDSNSGLSIEMSLLTINRALELCQIGDFIYIDSGYYSEYLNISKGSIRILPYNNADVTISAFDFIEDSQWVLHEGDIYKYQLASILPLGQNEIHTNSKELIEARWPKVNRQLDIHRDYCAISIDGFTDKSAPIDASNNYTGYYIQDGLANLSNITGAKIIFCAGREWWIKGGEVLAHTGNRIDIKYKYESSFGSDVDELTADDPFFLWNHYGLISQEGDYFFDITTLTLYLKSTLSPTNIKVRVREKVLTINANSVNVEGLKIKGRVEVLGNNCQLNNLDIERGFKDLTLTRNLSSVTLNGANNSIKNSAIYNSILRTSIDIYGSGHIIDNNIIHDIGGIQCRNGASSLTITRNTIWNTATVGVSITGIASEYSYNHIYNVVALSTDLAALNAWNSGDAQGTVVKYNHIHGDSAYFNPDTEHYGCSGIRLDSGGAALGCSNYKIHNNLVYDFSNDCIVTWNLLNTHSNYGNAQIYVVNNTIDGTLRYKEAGSNEFGGIYFKNNLAKEFSYNGVNDIPIAWTESTNNFFLDKLHRGNLTGEPQVKNWIPVTGSPLIDAGVQVIGINTIANPDIGWIEAGGNYVWGGAIEKDINKLSVSYDVYLQRLTITTSTPGKSLREDVNIRVNSTTTYPILGRKLNSDDTITHYFDIQESNNISLEIWIEGVYYSLGIINIPYLFNTQVDIDNNEIVILGGNYYTTEGKILHLATNSLPYGFDIEVVRIDIPDIQDISTIKVLNKVDGSIVRHWIEDIDIKNTNVPLHLDFSTIKLSNEGLVELDIIYDTGVSTPQSSVNDFYPVMGSFLDTGTNVLWLKSHLLEGYSNNTPISNWVGEGGSFTQSNSLYQPTYKTLEYNEWPGVYFNVSSIVGPSLGNGDYTIWVVYRADTSTNANPRLLSGGTPEGQDYTTGVQVLVETAQDGINRLVGFSVYSLTFTGKQLNTITLGSNYKNPANNSYKGSILEVLLVKGQLPITTDRQSIKKILDNKYNSTFSFSSTNLIHPIKVKLEDSLGNITIYENVNFINNGEIRIPYEGQEGTYNITVINPNSDEDTIVTNFTAPPTSIDYSLSINNQLYLSDSSIDLGVYQVNSPSTPIEIVITNNESNTLSLSNLIIPSGYNLIGDFPLSIAPNISTSFFIEVDTSTPNSLNEVLTFDINTTETYTLNISSTVLAPLLSVLDVGNNNNALVNGSDITLDSLYIGSTVEVFTFTIKNNDQGNLEINDIILSNNLFTLSTFIPFTLGFDEEQTFIISLDTSSSNTYSTFVNIQTNDLLHNDFQLSLSITINEPLVSQLEVKYNNIAISNGSNITLDSVYYTSTSLITLSIGNIGNADLLLNSISIPSNFQQIDGVYGVINPSSSVDYSFLIESDVVGNNVYPLVIDYDNAQLFNLNINLGVLGISLLEVNYESNPIESGSYTIEFGQVHQNYSTTKVINIGNIGQEPLLVTAITTSEAYTIDNLVYPYTIQPNDLLSLNINFNDQNNEGVYSGHLSIKSDSYIDGVFTIGLNGEVIEPLVALLEVKIGTQVYPNNDLYQLGSYLIEDNINISKEITLTNIGNDDLVISLITSTVGYNLSPIDLPLTLQPNEDITFNLIFDIPTEVTAGSYEGILTIDDIYSLTLNTVLTGEPLMRVVIEGEDITLESSINYGSYEEGSEFSASKEIFISNIGTDILELSTLIVPYGFILINDFPTSINSGDTNSFTIALENTLIEGEYGGYIGFNSNTTDVSEFFFYISGSIYTNSLIIKKDNKRIYNNSILVFSDIIKPNQGQILINFTNESENSIDITTINLPTPFFTLSPYPITIDSNSSYLLDIRIDSTSIEAMEYTRQLNIITTETKDNNYIFNLNAVIYEPFHELNIEDEDENILEEGISNIDYGSSTINLGITKSFILRNTGNIDLNINTITTPDGYSYSNITLPITLIPNEEVVMDITFDKEVEGSYSGSVVISGDINYTFHLLGEKYIVLEANIEAIYNGELINGKVLDFGDTPYREVRIKEIEIRNIGNKDLVIEDIVLGNGFILLNNSPPIVINPGDIYNAEIQIDSLSNDYSNSDYYNQAFIANDSINYPSLPFYVKGKVLKGRLEVSYNNVTLPSNYLIEYTTVYKGIELRLKRIYLRNIGNYHMTLDLMELNINPFRLIQNVSYPYVINPNTEFYIDIELDTTTEGDFNKEILFNTSINDLTFSLRFHALVTAIPISYLTTSSLNFPSLTPNDSFSEVITVYNSGSIPINISSIDLLNKLFTLDIPSLPIKLGPSFGMNIEREVNSSYVGTITDTLVMSDSQGNVKEFPISLTINGGVISVGNHILDYGTIFKDLTPIFRELSIRNDGNTPITLELSISNPIFTTSINTPMELGIGEERIIEISFEGDEGVYKEILSIQEVNGKAVSVEVDLRGNLLKSLEELLLIDNLLDITPNVNTLLSVTNNSDYPLTISNIYTYNEEISIESLLPILLEPGEAYGIELLYTGNGEGDKAELYIDIEGNIGQNQYTKTIDTPLYLSDRVRVNIALGAKDDIDLGLSYPIDSLIEFKYIPADLDLILEDTSINQGDIVSYQDLGRIKARSFIPNLYEVLYEVDIKGIKQEGILEINVKAESPLKAIDSNGQEIDGYIPLMLIKGLYPLNAPYFIEGDVMWVLKTEGMSLTDSTIAPRPPKSLIVDTEKLNREVVYKGGKPITLVQANETLQMVGTIDDGFSRNILIYCDQVPMKVLTINGLDIYRSKVKIGTVDYIYNLVPGVIRLMITSNNIKIINNEITKISITTSTLWLPKNEIYRIQTFKGVKELMVGVDTEGRNLETYLMRKYKPLDITLVSKD